MVVTLGPAPGGEEPTPGRGCGVLLRVVAPLRGTDPPHATQEPERPPTPLQAPLRYPHVLGPPLKPLDLREGDGVAMPRLGYVSAGWPLETPEEQETIRAPSHMTRKASYTLRVRGHS